MINVLIANKWATERDLDGLEESEVKDLLISSLEKKLNKKSHTRSDLSLRYNSNYCIYLLYELLLK